MIKLGKLLYTSHNILTVNVDSEKQDDRSNEVGAAEQHENPRCLPASAWFQCGYELENSLCLFLVKKKFYRILMMMFGNFLLI